MLGQHERCLAARELSRVRGQQDGCVRGDGGQQQGDGLPVQRQQQADLLRVPEAVDEQVGRLRHPVGGGRTGQLDPIGAVVQRQQRLGRVALTDQAAGEVGQAAQGSSRAVTTLGLAVADGVVEGAVAVTVTAWAPA